MNAEDAVELKDIEIRLLLEAVFDEYGFDFRDYAYSYLQRRIVYAMRSEKAGTVSALKEIIIRDPTAMDRLLIFLSVKVTSMFRDPTFYVAFREKVVPVLRTYPLVRVWHAGCSSGEEVYSMAILLEEEGIYDRCRLYATDLNAVSLEQARGAVYPLSSMREYSGNYLQAGGSGSLSDYYTARYDNAIFSSSLRRNVVFGRHNLATDSSFNQFHVVLCRNVLIYFGERLRNRTHGLLYDSLLTFGILGLGTTETVRFTPFESLYEEIDQATRLYHKLPPQ